MTIICPVQPIPFVSSPYGPRTDSFGNVSFHPGIDLAVPIGTPIVTPGDGIITNAHTDPNNDAGIHYDIDLDDGNATRLLHMSQLFFPAGTRVAQNQVIGLSGNTGASTGPHMHWEVYVPAGHLADPAPYLNLYVPPAPTPSPSSELQGEDDDMGAPGYSPDGTKIASVHIGRDGCPYLYIYDTTTDKVRIRNLGGTVITPAALPATTPAATQLNPVAQY